MPPSSSPGRRTIRLPDFDYSQPGIYFVTICTQHHRCLFGEVAGSEMQVNELGQSIQQACEGITRYSAGISPDSYVVMPNHVHLLVGITTPDVNVGLSAIVGRFKSYTTTCYRRLTGCHEPLWQRNYHEHVVRNDHALAQLRAYIAENPARWEADRLHPSRTSSCR